MIKFGPSGIDLAMSNENIKTTFDAIKYVSKYNLNLFEYSFGHGVRMSSKTAKQIGEIAKENNIEVSLHAPYYINLATSDDMIAINNHKHIFSCLDILDFMDMKRLVVHPGSVVKNTREVALNILIKRLDALIDEMNYLGYKNSIICLETLGKISQMGTSDEIIMLSKKYEQVIPCIDFGHINAREQGLLDSKKAFVDLISLYIDKLGYEKVNNCHVHFSKIEYSVKGEIRHLTFEDEKYGPRFEDMIDAMIDLNLSPYIICESGNTQFIDSLTMRDYYLSKIGG